MEIFELRRSGTSFCDSRVADQHEANAPNGTINYVEDNKRRRNTSQNMHADPANERFIETLIWKH
jgi:hypothetical protein